MSKPINWNEITRPLDLNLMRIPSNYIHGWTSFEHQDTGLLFHAEMASGELVEVRLDVIKPDVIRVRAAPGSIHEQKSELLVSDFWPPPDFFIKEEEGLVTLSTSRIRVEIQRTLWQIRVYDLDGEGEPFFSERIDNRAYGPNFEVLPIGFDRDEDGALHARESVAVSPGEAFYGFGERFTTLDRWDQEIVSWAADSGCVTSHRAYKNVPFFMSTAGYGMFVHTSFPTVFKMGTESSVTYSVHSADSQLDYFLIYGPAFKHILRRYSELTGFSPVPPKWSFGFWISRCMYQSRAEVEEVIRGLRERGFPCDVLSLDPAWMGDPPWTTLEWDREQFPDPDGMIHWMQDQGVRLCLWITPYIPEGTRLYEEGFGKGYFLRTGDGSLSPALEAFARGKLGVVDFTEPGQTSWFLEKLEALLDQGAAVFKTDFGEQAPVDAVYSDGKTGLEMHNLYPLLYNEAVFGLTQKKFGRGLVWGRSAYAGSQRCPVQWGGDSYASLPEMSGQMRGLLGYGMSGVPFCSHDIGGFDYSPHAFDRIRASRLDEEMLISANLESYPRDPVVYIRWLQFGVFSSHVRGHGKGPQEPWEYGAEAEAIARKYLELRYQLLPYIYSTAVQSSETGLPVVRPLVLEFQDDPTTFHVEMQYMFGDNMLVAPVTNPAGTHRVYLPEGEWVDFWTKEVLQGRRWLDLQVPLEILPLWVRRGAIIPLGPAMDFVDQKPLSPLSLLLFHPHSKQEITIHEEDSPDISVNYRMEGGCLEVGFDQAPGEVEILLYGTGYRQAKLNGVEIAINCIDGGQQLIVDGRTGGIVVFG